MALSSVSLASLRADEIDCIHFADGDGVPVTPDMLCASVSRSCCGGHVSLSVRCQETGRWAYAELPAGAALVLAQQLTECSESAKGPQHLGQLHLGEVGHVPAAFGGAGVGEDVHAPHVSSAFRTGHTAFVSPVGPRLEKCAHVLFEVLRFCLPRKLLFRFCASVHKLGIRVLQLFDVLFYRCQLVLGEGKPLFQDSSALDVAKGRNEPSER